MMRAPVVIHANPDSHQPYYRRLPGGGFVAIEITAGCDALGQEHFRGDVIVERRISLERRRGHVAPAVASAEAATAGLVLDELFPVAHSNAALASRCLELAGQRGREGVTAPE